LYKVFGVAAGVMVQVSLLIFILMPYMQTHDLTTAGFYDAGNTRFRYLAEMFYLTDFL
jgi:hypothetical protein